MSDKRFDATGVELKVGDVIDIRQTVNGQDEFFIASLEPLEVRYNYDRSRVYEYNMEELIAPCRFTGETEYYILERKD